MTGLERYCLLEEAEALDNALDRQGRRIADLRQRVAHLPDAVWLVRGLDRLADVCRSAAGHLRDVRQSGLTDLPQAPMPRATVIVTGAVPRAE